MPSTKKKAGEASQSAKELDEEFEDIPFVVAILTMINYAIITMFSHFREFLQTHGFRKSFAKQERPNQRDFPPLYRDFDSFYTRHIYRIIRDCWNLPICSVPGARVTLLERETQNQGWTFEFTGEKKEYLNTGSYNYLGFAESTGPCADQAANAIRHFGLSSCSPRTEIGTNKLHHELEQLVAQYVNKEDAITFGMGFATNSGNIPLFAGKGCLILSDQYNHTSLVLGCRLSGATIKVFKHNDMVALENLVRQSIIEGQPKTHLRWKKIIICVEGVYSMEGSLINLPEVVRIKKKYGAYIYLDEAHSIGALGKTGRGVTEHFGISSSDIDIMMGTFTKSFGSAGGYIAGDKNLINYLRIHSHANMYAASMSPPVVQQVISSMKIIMGLDGTDLGRKRIQQLADNAKFFRQGMKKLGFIIFGNDASPIVPMLLYLPSKIAATSRELKKRGVAAVVVGFPATSVTDSRTRFCLSAAHTREDLEKLLKIMDEVGDNLWLKYSRTHIASK